MEVARNRSAAQRTIPVKQAPSAMLMSSSVALEAVREVNEGAALTLKDVQERLHCEKKKAIRLIKNEPGVMKIGKSYLIPQSAFDRVLRRSLVAA
jgi:hypothetical protein